jgi:hypothetical protein
MFGLGTFFSTFFLSKRLLTGYVCRRPLRSCHYHSDRRSTEGILPPFRYSRFRYVPSLPLSFSPLSLFIPFQLCHVLTFLPSSEISASAGPWGAGGIVEAGREKAVLYSYVRSRGFYAGIEALYVTFLRFLSLFRRQQALQTDCFLLPFQTPTALKSGSLVSTRYV